MGKKSGSGTGIRIRDEQPGSYFRELKNNFLMRIRDPNWKKFGSGMEKTRIRNQHRGYATLISCLLQIRYGNLHPQGHGSETLNHTREDKQKKFSSGLSILRIVLSRIRIHLFTLMPILIRLFTLMRIRLWILPLIKVGCDRTGLENP
jgi:hypothetical protein